MDNKKELKRRIGVTIFLMLAAVGIWAYSYLTEYYKAEPEALEVLEEGKDTGTIYASASDSENLILKADGETDTGIVFYPGGKVEYTAYLPLLEQLREQGYDIVLVKMPFNLAFFDMNAAEDVLDNMDEELPEVKNWYIMGHSLGGATAVTVGRRSDISAVVDIDGTMLGEETGVEGGVVTINEEPYETPLFAIANEEHHRQEMEAVQNSYAYANNIVMKNATCGYETYFKNAGHMNFTDLPLISPFLANILGTGSVDAGECIDTMNSLILRFYDCYLKNEGEFSVEESY